MNDIPASLNDGLQNVATGAGTSRDPSTFSRWAYNGAVNSLGCGAPVITDPEIDAAYKTNWLVRKVHDLPPKEMTKEWRTWSLDEQKTKRIEAEEKRLGVRDKVKEALRIARLRGGAALVMGLPGNAASAAPKAGSQGGLRYLFVAPRSSIRIDGGLDWDLNSDTFGQPKMLEITTQSVGGAKIHPSRVIVFPGLPAGGSISVSDEDAFWGVSLMQSLDEALKNATLGQNSIAAMLPESMVDVISIPGLTDQVSTSEGEARVANRLRVAQLMRSMFQAAVLDGGDGSDGSGEKWETRQLSFAGLPEVGMFLLQMVAGATDIPITRLVGSPPKGMNATGEHDEENFLAFIRGEQKTLLRPRLERLDTYLLPSAGVADTDAAQWEFATLKRQSPAEQAEADEHVANTYAIVAGTGLVQHDALAATMVAALAESPNFPGLAEAVEKSSDPIPATMAAEQEADMNKATIRKLETPAGPKTLRKPARDAMLTDARPMTLYVSRRVMNPQEVLNHFRRQGLDLPLTAAGELHVTLIHSKTPVDWMRVPADWGFNSDNGRLIVPPGGARVMELFGPLQNTLVLSFVSSDLAYRNRVLQEAGIDTEWPDYQPHVTIAKPVPADFDLKAVKPYLGRLVFGPEIFEEVI